MEMIHPERSRRKNLYERALIGVGIAGIAAGAALSRVSDLECNEVEFHRVSGQFVFSPPVKATRERYLDWNEKKNEWEWESSIVKRQELPVGDITYCYTD